MAASDTPFFQPRCLSHRVVLFANFSKDPPPPRVQAGALRLSVGMETTKTFRHDVEEAPALFCTVEASTYWQKPIGSRWPRSNIIKMFLSPPMKHLRTLMGLEVIVHPTAAGSRTLYERILYERVLFGLHPVFIRSVDCLFQKIHGPSR